MTNQYNVTLLIEDNACALIYASEIESFTQALSYNTNILNVDYYKFKSENNKLVLDTSYDTANNETSLVFIVSSATSTIWKNGEIYNLLENLQSNALVNIINLLPKKMWEKTSLDTYSNLITIDPTVQNNNKINNTLPYLISKDEFDNSLIVPIIEINKADKLLATIIEGGKVDNALLYSGVQHIPSYTSSEQLSTNQEIKNYRVLCSDEAFSLTMYLSVLKSFTISDMQYIQEYMLPGTNKSVLAECMLGGVVEINADTDSSYKIKDNIKEELSNTISATKAYSIKLLMKELTNTEFDKDYKSEEQNKFKM